MAFIKDLPLNTKLYRSGNKQSDLNGSWFCFNPNDTFGYGKITGEFQTKRVLKLIDITHPDFYNDYSHKLIQISKVNNDINTIKGQLLFPIGFIDINIYLEFAKSLSLQVSPSSLDVGIESQFFGGRSRCSIHILDTNFINIIKEIYGLASDGIISPQRLPDRIRNGLHHSELCIFDINSIQYIDIIPRNIIGGDNKIPILTGFDFRSDKIKMVTSIVNNYIESQKTTKSVNTIGGNKIRTTRRKRHS